METLTINLADLTEEQHQILFRNVLGDEKVAPSPGVLVKEFHETYKQPIRTMPSLNVPETEMRVGLIEEELQELRDALDADSIVDVADALADLVYVTYGAALTWGIPLDEVLEQVQASNLSKLGEDGKPIFRADGKVLKGPGFFTPEPRIEQVLQETIKKYVEEEAGGFAEFADNQAEVVRD